MRAEKLFVKSPWSAQLDGKRFRLWIWFSRHWYKCNRLWRNSFKHIAVHAAADQRLAKNKAAFAAPILLLLRHLLFVHALHPFNKGAILRQVILKSLKACSPVRNL